MHTFLVPRKKKLKKQLFLNHRKIALIPINIVLKKFWELPNVFNSIMEYMNDSKNYTTLQTSVYHGKMWNSIKLKQNECNLPIAIFFNF